jgi:hypothetical protein
MRKRGRGQDVPVRADVEDTVSGMGQAVAGVAKDEDGVADWHGGETAAGVVEVLKSCENGDEEDTRNDG